MLERTGNKERAADRHLHVLHFSRCVCSDVKEEKSRATVTQAALRRVFRVLIECEAHTSSAVYLSKMANYFLLLSLKVLSRYSSRYIPPMTTFANPLIASPCHLGIGDLPLSLVSPAPRNKFIYATESINFNPAMKRWFSSNEMLQSCKTSLA